MIIAQTKEMDTETIAGRFALLQEATLHQAYPSYQQRLQWLKQWRQLLLDNEEAILTALEIDLGKNNFESFTSEIAILLDEIKVAQKLLKKFMRGRRVSTPLALFPARSRLYPVPYGVVLVMAPWNYPWQLAVSPCIEAMAAGNRILLKPSELAPATSALLVEAIAKYFTPSEVAVITGGAEVAQTALQLPVDKIFFTGSPAVGRLVMAAAAKNLTPVTLELGGKAPAIVLADADIPLAARKIAWGKWMNCGQTCVAPDTVWVDEKIADYFKRELIKNITDFYGEDSERSVDYGRIVNEKNWHRQQSYITWAKEQGATVLHGGKGREYNFFLAPTILDFMGKANQHLIADEIFGPILPLHSFSSSSDAASEQPWQQKEFRTAHAKALAFYLFTQNKKHWQNALENFPFATGALNETILQVANPYLPFGGLGSSGLGGQYHGWEGLRCFSHEKSIMEAGGGLLARFFDRFFLQVRYPPFFGKMKLAIIKKLFSL